MVRCSLPLVLHTKFGSAVIVASRPSDSVSHLKSKIAESIGISSIEQLALSLDANGTSLSDNAQTLSAAGLRPGQSSVTVGFGGKALKAASRTQRLLYRGFAVFVALILLAAPAIRSTLESGQPRALAMKSRGESFTPKATAAGDESSPSLFSGLPSISDLVAPVYDLVSGPPASSSGGKPSSHPHLSRRRSSRQRTRREQRRRSMQQRRREQRKRQQQGGRGEGESREGCRAEGCRAEGGRAEGGRREGGRREGGFEESRSSGRGEGESRRLPRRRRPQRRRPQRRRPQSRRLRRKQKQPRRQRRGQRASRPRQRAMSRLRRSSPAFRLSATSLRQSTIW